MYEFEVLLKNGETTFVYGYSEADFRTPTQFENYTVYPILCNGERYGYVCSHSHRIAEVVMIVRYLAAAAVCSD